MVKRLKLRSVSHLSYINHCHSIVQISKIPFVVQSVSSHISNTSSVDCCGGVVILNPCLSHTFIELILS